MATGRSITASGWNAEETHPGPWTHDRPGQPHRKISYWQEEYHQSASDARGVSTADYIHAMFAFLMQAKSRDVLMIGCGGGTLATMLHTRGVGVTIVDINRLSFDIAHDYFRLPREISCHVADGIAYLKTIPTGMMRWCWTHSARRACPRPSAHPDSSNSPNRGCARAVACS